MDAIVLAAGQSSRLGQPKQLLDFNGQSLLQHCLSIYRKSSLEKLHLVLGANHEKITDSIQTDERIVVHVNTDWERGMGSSISFGMRCVCEESLLPTAIMLLLGDQPHIKPTHLNQMIEAFSTNEARIACAHYGSKSFGPPVIFSEQYFTALSSLTNNEGARSIINSNQNDVLKVKLKNFNSADIDSIEDYHQALRLLEDRKL